MKKCISVIFAVFFMCTLLTTPVAAVGFAMPESLQITANAVYFVNTDSGIPVVAINEHEKRDIASLTKLMTSLLLIENVPDLDGTTITAPVELYQYPITGSEASTADIRPNETVTARTLLYAMLLPSGNEAAAIAAYLVGNGNLDNFYAMMNARAAELGCLNTHFSNPHGLLGMAEDNYSTAYDQYLIANACWQYDVFRTVASSSSYGMPFTNIHSTAEYSTVPDVAYTIYSTIRMQNPTNAAYKSYIHGMKTGYTTEAGRCFVSGATNDRGENFIGVVLGCSSELAPDGSNYSFYDTAAVYEWIFDNFSVQPTLEMDMPITEVPVELSSETDVLQLYPEQAFQTFLPNEGGAALLTQEFDVPETLDAPIQAGDVIGTVTLLLQGETLGTVNLLAGTDIAINPVLYAFRVIGDFFKGTYFRVVMILCAIYIIGYFALMSHFRKQQKAKRAAQQRRWQQQMQESPLAGGPRYGDLTETPVTRRSNPTATPPVRRGSHYGAGKSPPRSGSHYKGK